EPFAVLLMSSNGSRAAAVVESANSSLAEYQKIRQWFVWPEADFPRTPTQKPVLPRIREVVRNAGGQQSEAASRQTGQDGGALPPLIARITGKPAETYAKNANLETDLQLTSLDRVELMSALEDRYQMDLSEVSFQDAATLGQLETLIARGADVTTDH